MQRTAYSFLFTGLIRHQVRQKYFSRRHNWLNVSKAQNIITSIRKTCDNRRIPRRPITSLLPRQCALLLNTQRGHELITALAKYQLIIAAAPVSEGLIVREAARTDSYAPFRKGMYIYGCMFVYNIENGVLLFNFTVYCPRANLRLTEKPIRFQLEMG